MNHVLSGQVRHRVGVQADSILIFIPDDVEDCVSHIGCPRIGRDELDRLCSDEGPVSPSAFLAEGGSRLGGDLLAAVDAGVGIHINLV